MVYNYGSLSTWAAGNGQWWNGASPATWYSGQRSAPSFSYKDGAIQSMHGANFTAADPGNDAVATIRCSYCHDVHNTFPAGTGETAAEVDGPPYLRGAWKGNPFPEDGAPQSGQSFPRITSGASAIGPFPRANTAARSADASKLGGYFINQNTAAAGNTANTPVANTNAGGLNSDAAIDNWASLCEKCHYTNTNPTFAGSGKGAWTAAEIDGINWTGYTNAQTNKWSGALANGSGGAAVAKWAGASANGHANSVLGGTGSGSTAASDIYNERIRLNGTYGLGGNNGVNAGKPAAAYMNYGVTASGCTASARTPRSAAARGPSRRGSTTRASPTRTPGPAPTVLELEEHHAGGAAGLRGPDGGEPGRHEQQVPPVPLLQVPHAARLTAAAADAHELRGRQARHVDGCGGELVDPDHDGDEHRTRKRQLLRSEQDLAPDHRGDQLSPGGRHVAEHHAGADAGQGLEHGDPVVSERVTASRRTRYRGEGRMTTMRSLARRMTAGAVLPLLLALSLPANARQLRGEDFEKGGGEMAGKAVNTPFGRGWRSTVGGNTNEGADMLQFPAAGLLGPGGGTVELDVVRDNAADTSEGLFAFVGADRRVTLSVSIEWQGAGISATPLLEVAGSTPFGRSLWTAEIKGIVHQGLPFPGDVAVGEAVHVSFAWGPGAADCAFFVNGVELKGERSRTLADDLELLATTAAWLYVGGEPRFGQEGGANNLMTSVLRSLYVYGEPLDGRDLYRNPDKYRASAAPIVTAIDHNAAQVAGFSGKLVAGNTLGITIDRHAGGDGDLRHRALPGPGARITVRLEGLGGRPRGARPFLAEGEINLRES